MVRPGVDHVLRSGQAHVRPFLGLLTNDIMLFGKQVFNGDMLRNNSVLDKKSVLIIQ